MLYSFFKHVLTYCRNADAELSLCLLIDVTSNFAARTTALRVTSQKFIDQLKKNRQIKLGKLVTDLTVVIRGMIKMPQNIDHCRDSSKLMELTLERPTSVLICARESICDTVST